PTRRSACLLHLPGQRAAAAPLSPNGVFLIMINIPLVRGLSTRRLILLATVANLGVAAVVIGGSSQSFVPALPTATAAENAQRPVGFADLADKVKPAVISVRVKMDAGTKMMGFEGN